MGKKIREILKSKDIGAIGIGAMIVFIAMVLVAGIAASVLVQTSTKLETQAMASGSETIAEVSTGIAVEDVYGHKSAATAIDEIAIYVRPRAGSTDIDLEQTVIELSDSTTKNLLIYDSTSFADTDAINGDIFALPAFNGGAAQFRVVVLEDADSSCSGPTPVINKGDHVILCVDIGTALGNLAPRTDVFGQVITEDGAPGVIGFTSPASYIDTVIELQ
jgi:flagellin FlaB